MVGAWRHEASTLAGSELGGWPEGPWVTRLLRRVRLPAAMVAPLGFVSPRCRILAEDLAFWAGARGEATAPEWRRLTSSYSVLVYHRFAGELKPGQERIDISPRRFQRQVRALRLLGFRSLDPDRLLAFHRGEEEVPRRSFVLTVDDATADSVEPLRRAAGWNPQLFVPTAELGGTAHWLDGEPVATWSEVEELAAAGVAIGSHTRHHHRLSKLSGPLREAELAGSLTDLRGRLPRPLAVIAYPNGDHDDAVCEATRAAGYELGFTTEKGRNGAGTDPYRLRRVSIHGADGALAAVWKAATGQALPRLWPRLRR
ncbi:MAG TPA: polysaccharide deacetylase family protein [Solirubrobacterales bacterium]|nr:polysaccharide deacetylase family protein [Solirubrobacterales bacterium]